MTSPTEKTEKCRAAKTAKQGRARKNALARTGTTPKLFTLNKPVATTEKK